MKLHYLPLNDGKSEKQNWCRVLKSLWLYKAQKLWPLILRTLFWTWHLFVIVICFLVNSRVVIRTLNNKSNNNKTHYCFLLSKIFYSVVWNWFHVVQQQKQMKNLRAKKFHDRKALTVRDIQKDCQEENWHHSTLKSYLSEAHIYNLYNHYTRDLLGL